MRTLIMLLALLFGSVAGVSVAEARGGDAHGRPAAKGHEQKGKTHAQEMKEKGKETPAVPELDPDSASAAVMLLLGGAAAVAGRRRRAAI